MVRRLCAVVASGWLSGEKTIAGRPVVVETALGKGRIVMFGLRPQFRGQPWGTFKLLLDSVYLAPARKL